MAAKAAWAALKPLQQVVRNILRPAGGEAEGEEALVDLQVGKTVWYGVPRKMREELWLGVLHRGGVGSGAAAKYPTVLAQAASCLSEETLSDIDKDVGRTFPDHPRFASEAGRAALAGVLRAYAAFDAEVGYCQGMNFLAGLLLAWLPQEADAFGGLVVLMHERRLRELYKQDLGLLQVRVWQVGHLLPGGLAEHLEGAGALAVLYCAPWLLTCFAASFPLSFASRVMDVVLTDSYHHAMMKVAIGILRSCEAQLLGMTDMEDMVDFLKTGVPQWPREKLHELLTAALRAPWTARQLALLDQESGAESVIEAVARLERRATADSADLTPRSSASGSQPHTPASPLKLSPLQPGSTLEWGATALRSSRSEAAGTLARNTSAGGSGGRRLVHTMSEYRALQARRGTADELPAGLAPSPPPRSMRHTADDWAAPTGRLSPPAPASIPTVTTDQLASITISPGIGQPARAGSADSSTLSSPPLATRSLPASRGETPPPPGLSARRAASRSPARRSSALAACSLPSPSGANCAALLAGDLPLDRVNFAGEQAAPSAPSAVAAPALLAAAPAAAPLGHLLHEDLQPGLGAADSLADAGGAGRELDGHSANGLQAAREWAAFGAALDAAVAPCSQAPSCKPVAHGKHSRHHTRQKSEYEFTDFTSAEAAAGEADFAQFGDFADTDALAALGQGGPAEATNSDSPVQRHRSAATVHLLNRGTTGSQDSPVQHRGRGGDHSQQAHTGASPANSHAGGSPLHAPHSPRQHRPHHHSPQHHQSPGGRHRRSPSKGARAAQAGDAAPSPDATGSASAGRPDARLALKGSSKRALLEQQQLAAFERYSAGC